MGHAPKFLMVSFFVLSRLSISIPWTFKVGLSPSKKNCFYLLLWKPFKNDEHWSLFHVKNSFHTWDIYMFVLWLISKFMTSQTQQLIIKIPIFFNISRSKGNQTIKFGYLLKCNKGNSVLEKTYPNLVGKLVLEFFIKAKLSISPNQQSKML